MLLAMTQTLKRSGIEKGSRGKVLKTAVLATLGQLSGDDYLHDIPGAIGKVKADGVPKTQGEGEFLAISIMPVDKQGFEDGINGCFGAKPFGHSCFLSMGQFLVNERKRLVA